MKKNIAIRRCMYLVAIVTVSFLAGGAFTFFSDSAPPNVVVASPANSAGFLMLSAPDFGSNGDYLGVQEGLNPGYSAALHLPPGAKVSRITTYYAASSPVTFTTYISVESQSFDVFNILVASEISPITQTGNLTQSTPVMNLTAIDNSLYAYRIRIRTNGNGPSAPCPPGSTCGYSVQATSNPYRIYQIRIEYTIDSFLPSITR